VWTGSATLTFRDRSVAAPLKLAVAVGPLEDLAVFPRQISRGPIEAHQTAGWIGEAHALGRITAGKRKEDAQRNIIRVDDIPNKDGSWLQGLLGKIGSNIHYERTFPLPTRNMADDK
jgi:hypothetical protein